VTNPVQSFNSKDARLLGSVLVIFNLNYSGKSACDWNNGLAIV